MVTPSTTPWFTKDKTHTSLTRVQLQGYTSRPRSPFVLWMQSLPGLTVDLRSKPCVETNPPPPTHAPNLLPPHYPSKNIPSTHPCSQIPECSRRWSPSRSPGLAKARLSRVKWRQFLGQTHLRRFWVNQLSSFLCCLTSQSL